MAEVRDMRLDTPPEQRAFLVGWNARGTAGAEALDRAAERYRRARRWYWLGFCGWVLLGLARLLGVL